MLAPGGRSEMQGTGDGANNQVDSVMNKLAIERRVQYGAEKMLDVSVGCAR